jgi:hypothetical protein
VLVASPAIKAAHDSPQALGVIAAAGNPASSSFPTRSTTGWLCRHGGDGARFADAIVNL